MSKYISGEDLLDKWDIYPVELIEYIKTGQLRPYSQSGKLIPHPYYQPMSVIEDLRKTFKYYSSSVKKVTKNDQEKIKKEKDPVAAIGLGLTTISSSILAMDYGRKLSQYESVSRELLGWKNFELPQYEQESEKILQLLIDSLYLNDEVSAIEKIARQRKVTNTGNMLNDSKEKKLRPNQRHKLQSREIAEKLWGKDPTITIADMINEPEIIAACDDKFYIEKTVRDWIKDLCPNRKPGRRSEKE